MIYDTSSFFSDLYWTLILSEVNDTGTCLIRVTKTGIYEEIIIRQRFQK